LLWIAPEAEMGNCSSANSNNDGKPKTSSSDGDDIDESPHLSGNKSTKELASDSHESQFQSREYFTPREDIGGILTGSEDGGRFLMDPTEILDILHTIRRDTTLDEKRLLDAMKKAICDVKSLPDHAFNNELFTLYEERWWRQETDADSVISSSVNAPNNNKQLLKYVFWVISLQQYIVTKAIPLPDEKILEEYNCLESEIRPTDKPEYLLGYLRAMNALLELKVNPTQNKATFVAVCGCLEGSGKFYYIDGNGNANVTRRVNIYHKLTGVAQKKKSKKHKPDDLFVDVEGSLDRCLKRLKRIRDDSQGGETAVVDLLQQNPHIVQSVEVIKLCLEQLESSMETQSNFV
jgi:hypothetical protein